MFSTSCDYVTMLIGFDPGSKLVTCSNGCSLVGFHFLLTQAWTTHTAEKSLKTDFCSLIYHCFQLISWLNES